MNSAEIYRYAKAKEIDMDKFQSFRRDLQEKHSNGFINDKGYQDEMRRYVKECIEGAGEIYTPDNETLAAFIEGLGKNSSLPAYENRWFLEAKRLRALNG